MDMADHLYDHHREQEGKKEKEEKGYA